jgi:DNA helicase II / ATP-dependent DNA helicase PcrA
MYQNRFIYIMVDEYQDTNIIQYDIVRLLALKNKNLAVVGDDWQSIYSWRGADMRNILNFQKDYPLAKIVKLEQNYRSTKKIISAANEVIKNNKNAMKKTLWTENIDGDHINLISAPDDRSEAQKIVQIIKSE